MELVPILDSYPLYRRRAVGGCFPLQTNSPEGQWWPIRNGFHDGVPLR